MLLGSIKLTGSYSPPRQSTLTPTPRLPASTMLRSVLAAPPARTSAPLGYSRILLKMSTCNASKQTIRNDGMWPPILIGTGLGFMNIRQLATRSRPWFGMHGTPTSRRSSLRFDVSKSQWNGYFWLDSAVSEAPCGTKYLRLVRMLHGCFHPKYTPVADKEVTSTSFGSPYGG